MMIFVVEDEPKIAKLIMDYLDAHGFSHQWFDHGIDVVTKVRELKPDLMLLDVGLPGKDGMQICKEVREFSDLPIIMVTARVEELDRLLGLELGADDYICKPFSPREVVARVKAVLRRGEAKRMGKKSPFEVDQDGRRIFILGTEITLTPNEFNILAHFIQHPGRVYSRDQLLDQLYDDFRAVSDRTVDSHIKNLRKKLTKALPDKDVIVSVYGVGYKLSTDDLD